MPVTYEQLDLFSIADQNEHEATCGNTKKFNDIVVGDILHVKWSNGIEWEGPYTGLTGFWDGRADAKSWHWMWATKCWSHGEERPAADYKWFVPQMESWYYVGHDDSFQLPDKETVLERLIDRIKPLPYLRSRLNEFQRFEHEYPYLAETWCERGFMSKQWHKAICAVTTLDDVLEQHQYWSNKAEPNKQAESYIRDVVFSLPGPERLQALNRIRWSEKSYIDTRGKQSYTVYCFPTYDEQMTVYVALLARSVEQARTPEELVLIAKLWGTNQRIVDKPSKAFWIEEDT